MDEKQWLACTDPLPLLEFLRAGGKASERKQRLFCVACCRRVWHLLVDNRSRQAVEVAERFADGAATEQELEAARQVAWEFTLHTVHDDEAFFDLEAAALDAADAPAWTAEWPVEPVRVVVAAQRALGPGEGKAQADLLRDIFGPLPFLPHPPPDPAWLSWNSATVVSLAQGIYEERAFDRLPILGDALEDAGCQDAEVLGHCRSGGEHTRGCFLVDWVLGKE